MPQDIGENTITTVQIARVPPTVAARLERHRLATGDIVFSRRGDVTRRALVREDSAEWLCGTGCLRVRPGSAVDSQFLSYLLGTADARDWLLGNAVGTNMLNLNTTILGRLPLNVPPRPEQQAIAEVLGALDDKIAANTAFATTVDSYLAALLDEMATGVTATTLRSIADVNARSVKPVADGILRYVDIASVATGSFEYPDVTAWSDAPGRARRGLAMGDTMWSTVRPNRRSHALNLENDALLVASTGLAVLSPREVGFAYLYEASRRPEFTAYLENVAEGSAYPAVRADRFLEAPVPDLPADHIRAFEAQAAPLRELVASHARENRTLAATRDALLPQLMSGKLRVRDAETLASAVI
ncbi:MULTISPECIES: restriction endonuclease subunit S [unclassified Microbacterium]|uniref:restriction endonuclease subunit S n=1 Tax=unclassified Microbacterium TaxID=2609290 RepID=UPI001AC9B8BA|nr:MULTISPECIES: restriction endonuclease subunit S [unclassified Microbacterium]MBN9214866.1 restriction endonuclease subunit S [Microbacterium sp.]